MHDYSGFSDFLPPDVAGYDGLDGRFNLDRLKQLAPSMDELKAAAVVSGGVLGGLTLGLMGERLANEKLPALPSWAFPLIHMGAGLAGGRALSKYNMEAGVGLAAGFGALSLMRALSLWFGIDVALSGLDGADLSGLGDMLAGSNLLPPELQGADLGTLAIEEQDMGGLAIEEQQINAFAEWPSL